MTSHRLCSAVLGAFLSTAIHAEDFLIIGDIGELTISRIALNGDTQLLVPHISGGRAITKSFAVHQYNRHLYYLRRPNLGQGDDEFIGKSLESGVTSIVSNQWDSHDPKVIIPADNVYLMGGFLEYTLSGIRRMHVVSSRPMPDYAIRDYDVASRYIVGGNDHFVMGTLPDGGEVQQLLFSPSFEFDDVSIDATSGIIYAVNEAGGLYSVNPDGSDPAFLGNSGVSPQSEHDFYLDAYNDVLYLGHKDSVYSISMDQVGNPSFVCNACATSINRIQYVVDDFAQAGDTDVDYDVDITDFNNLASNFDPIGFLDRIWKDGDFDGNHIVDITDFNALSDNFSPNGYDSHLNLGGSVQTPEPASIFLVAVAMILVSGYWRMARHSPSVRIRAPVDTFVTLEACSRP